MFKVFHWWCFNVYDVFDTQLISVLFVSLANLFYCHAAPPIIKAPQFQSSISDTMMTIRLYKASEKHGPITHYILVVVPDDLARTKTPADFKLEEVNISGFLLSGSVIYDPHAPHLTHWGQDKMDAISQTTFSNAFSWMKMLEFRLIFHWSLFLRV